jgi:hypothetical protein
MSDKPTIDLPSLAYRTGMPPEDVRVMGAEIFGQLSGGNPALTKALVSAATARGWDAQQVLSMMTTMAEDFRRPFPEQAMSLPDKATAAGMAAKEKLDQSADYVRSSLNRIDLDSIRETGSDKLREVREKIAGIDIAELGDRAKEAGQSMVENAQAFARSVNGAFSAPPADTPGGDDSKR